MPQKSKQELLEKLSPDKFISLKLYPNKQLLSKSKIIKFTDYGKCFDERARLFIENCYLLIKAQIENSHFYISTNIFINFYSTVFMMYSFDDQYKQKMKLIKSGNLINEIILSFDIIFNYSASFQKNNQSGNMIEENEKNILGDFQRKQIFQNSIDLIQYLEEVGEKSKHYYYQANNDIYTCDPESHFEPSNPYAVLLKLQNSLIFRQHSFHLKCEHGELIRPFLELKSSLWNQYKNLLSLNQKMFESMTVKYCEYNPKQYSMKYQQQLLTIFKVLQKQNYIKIINLQQEEQESINTTNKQNLFFQIKFQTNLRKYSHSSKTSNEQSSESLNSANQESIKLNKMNECKNAIDIHIKVQLIEQKLFVFDIQAMFKWIIEQFYFKDISKVWNQFVSNWSNFIFESEDLYFEKNHPFKFQMFHSKPKVGIKTIITVKMGPSIMKEVFLAIDRIIIFFLLFENIFKTITKFSLHFIGDYDDYVKKISSLAYLEDMISQLNYASLDYQHYFNSLENMEK